jgi:hypothetical protein
VIAVVVILVLALLAWRTARSWARPTEIDQFRAASDLTSAWSRGEAVPPAWQPYPQEQQGQDEQEQERVADEPQRSTLRHGR